MSVKESPVGRDGGVYLRCVHLGTSLHLDQLAILVELIHRGPKQLSRSAVLNHWFILLLPALDVHTARSCTYMSLYETKTMLSTCIKVSNNAGLYDYDHALTGFSYCTPCRIGGLTTILASRDSR